MPLFYVFSRAAGSPVCNAARRSHAFPQVRCGYSGRGVTEDGREVPLGGVSARCEDSVSRPPRKQGCLRYERWEQDVVRGGLVAWSRWTECRRDAKILCPDRPRKQCGLRYERREQDVVRGGLVVGSWLGGDVTSTYL